MCTLRKDFHDSPELFLQKAEILLENSGGQLIGDAGGGSLKLNSPVGALRGAYRIKGNSFEVQVEDKPFFLNCGTIRKVFDKYMLSVDAVEAHPDTNAIVAEKVERAAKATEPLPKRPNSRTHSGVVREVIGHKVTLHPRMKLYVRDSECKFSLPVKGDLEALFEQIHHAFELADGHFEGDTRRGSFFTNTLMGKLVGSYRMKNGQLHVHITKKPFLLKSELIEAQVRHFMTKAEQLIEQRNRGKDSTATDFTIRIPVKLEHDEMVELINKGMAEAHGTLAGNEDYGLFVLPTEFGPARGNFRLEERCLFIHVTDKPLALDEERFSKFLTGYLTEAQDTYLEEHREAAQQNQPWWKRLFR